jgi:hypothetical protein
MRPVLRGLCKFEELKLTNLDLCDFADMNEALDVEEMNKRIIHEAMEKA